AGGVQTVSRIEIIWKRHFADQGFDPTGAVERGSVRIPGSENVVHVSAEHVDGLQASAIDRGIDAGRCDRISGTVNNRIVSGSISVLHAGEEAEKSLPGLVRQNRTCEVALRDIALTIEQEEEKRLVLDDRSADASPELVAVAVVLADAVEVVAPG